jgi:hypothetical protein
MRVSARVWTNSCCSTHSIPTMYPFHPYHAPIINPSSLPPPTPFDLVHRVARHAPPSILHLQSWRGQVQMPANPHLNGPPTTEGGACRLSPSSRPRPRAASHQPGPLLLHHDEPQQLQPPQQPAGVSWSGSSAGQHGCGPLPAAAGAPAAFVPSFVRRSLGASMSRPSSLRTSLITSFARSSYDSSISQSDYSPGQQEVGQPSNCAF